MKADVAFVLLSFNDSEHVLKAVSSIRRLKTRIPYAITIVDNGSSDRTPEIVREKFKDVAIIRLQKNIGTAAFNRIVPKLKCKYLFFAGSDFEFREDMLNPLVDFLERNEACALVSPKCFDFHSREKVQAGGTWLSRSFYSGRIEDNSLGEVPVEIPYRGMGLIRVDALKKIKYLYDPDYFFYGEDVDLGMRLRLLGYSICFHPKSIVYHHGSLSRRIHDKHLLTYLMERNLLRTFLTTFSFATIMLYVSYVLAARLFAIVRDLVTLSWSNAFSRVLALLWMPVNILTILKKRRQVQRSRVVSDDVIIDCLTEKYVLMPCNTIRKS